MVPMARCVEHVERPGIRHPGVVDIPQAARLLLDESDALGRELTDQIWQHLPGYESAWMEAEELSEMVISNVHTLLSAALAGRRPEGAELEPAVRLGERRAAQGVPIEAVLRSWHTAERVLSGRLVQAYSPDLQGGRRATERLAVAVDTLTDASVASYRRTQAAATGEYGEEAIDLVSRLAAGEPLAAVEVERQAAMIGVDVGRPHRAVVLAVGRADAVGLARSLRVLLEHVQPHAHGRVMTGYHRGMVVLLTADSGGLPGALARAVQRAELPLPALIGVGDPRPRLGEIGASCREAVAAAEVSLTVGRRRTTAYFGDVLPEVLLRDNPVTARRLVRARLGPVLERPALLETLVAYLGSGLSLRAAARALRIHENTASHRLQRILELLGAENSAALVRADLLLALLAHRLTATED
jgi:DNA-binding CsgD family transcriptional regulator